MDLTDGRISPASNDAICVPKPKVCAAELGIKSTPAVHPAKDFQSSKCPSSSFILLLYFHLFHAQQQLTADRSADFECSAQISKDQNE
jgi:hypothetical protein